MSRPRSVFDLDLRNPDDMREYKRLWWAKKRAGRKFRRAKASRALKKLAPATGEPAAGPAWRMTPLAERLLAGGMARTTRFPAGANPRINCP